MIQPAVSWDRRPCRCEFLRHVDCHGRNYNDLITRPVLLAGSAGQNRLEQAGQDQQQADDSQGRADDGEACDRFGMRYPREAKAFKPVFQPE
jgi:hypothetical protein